MKTNLTCIIPFMNEGEEIEKTVRSIINTSNAEIMLINDCSTDSYDYEEVADLYDCIYIKNETNLGVAGSRDLGVKNCKTDYFVLLDGHMRFYDNNWDLRTIEYLFKNPKTILSSNTSIITRENGRYINEDGEVRQMYGGAKINLVEPGWELTSKWTNNFLSDEDIVPVCSVMGAFYASSKEWWNYIGGLKGLLKYGDDEPLMSLKTWLSGGKCVLDKNFFVGHVYKDKLPYTVPSSKVYSNRILLINLFGEDKKNLFLDNLRNRIGQEKFDAAMEEFKTIDFESIKQSFEKIKIHTLDWFDENYNSKV